MLPKYIVIPNSAMVYRNFWNNVCHTIRQLVAIIVTTGCILIYKAIHTHTQHTLWTDHSCIVPVTTVVDTTPHVTAIHKVWLISSAAHFIQEDWSSPRTKDAIVVCISDCYSICKLSNIYACSCMTTTHTIMFCCFNYTVTTSLVCVFQDMTSYEGSMAQMMHMTMMI